MLLGATKMAEPEDEAPPILLPCSYCSRTFKPESLQKHAKACEKQATKKRKVFDSSKQRIQGTELAEFLPKLLREKKSEKVVIKKPESHWKERHLEFVAAIRAARGVEPPPKVSSSASKSYNEKCPHCDRNFGPKAFDRHIEWCKEQKARIPKSPASLIQAKERLEARTKYRAPPLAKSKRTLTREKYAKVTQHTSKDSSPSGSRSAPAFSKPPPQEVKVPETVSRIPGVRHKPKLSSSSPSCTLPSGNAQVKKREPSPSPSKRPIRSGSKIAKKEPARAKKDETNNHTSLFSSSCNITKLRPSEERHRGRELKPKPGESSSSEEVYDPYISAERQMMELLSQGDYVQPPPRQKKNIPSSHAESSTVFPSFESSHQSAFVRYSPPNLPDFTNETAIPSSLIAEFDDLFRAECQKSNYIMDTVILDEQNQNIPLTLSSIGLNLSIDNVDQPVRRTSKIRAKMESAALSLQRSVSLMNYENDMKVGTEASSLMQSDRDNNPLPTLSEFSSFPCSSPEPPRVFPSPKSHIEKYDANKRIAEETFSLKSESSISNEMFTHPKSYSAGGKFSADSAYGSLNRRSPTHSTHSARSGNQMSGKNEEMEGERMCFMSSSSSESSLPPLCSVVKHEASNPSLSPSPPHAVDASPVLQSAPRMSKFCHECGSKYPVSLAKFCCECGVRRLAM